MYIREYGKPETCTVKMSKELARLCTPYKGCPRGPIGVPYIENEEYGMIELVKRILLGNGGYILEGEDENFVCIPVLQYEFLLEKLKLLELKGENG